MASRLHLRAEPPLPTVEVGGGGAAHENAESWEWRSKESATEGENQLTMTRFFVVVLFGAFKKVVLVTTFMA